MSRGLGYTDVEEGRDGLPGGPLYKFEKGEKTKLGNGQKGVKISTYFVKMSFRYICALTSHFVIFCEFEFSVCSTTYLFSFCCPSLALVPYQGLLRVFHDVS